ncbi:MAG: HAD family hydrolase [Cyanobacteria bacterium P01_A01_bin.17]
MNSPQTLALDFDGIICNGLQEYFQTTWRAYCQVWSTSSGTAPETLAQQFYRLRPVVETGWEMPVLLRAVLKGFSEKAILQNWPGIRDRVVVEDDLNPKILATQVDTVRDRWLNSDLESWLALHTFYEGVIPKLQALSEQLPIVIITTKESRFVKALLQQAGLQIPDDRLFGKDCRRPKAETLRQLKTTIPTPIWFIEDRLATLQAIKQQPDLADIALFLGDWGYNTQQQQQAANRDPRIHRLSLAQFGQEFSGWL